MTITMQKRQVSLHSTVLKEIQTANLLNKRTGFYIRKFIYITLLSLLVWSGVILLASHPYVLFLAPLLGILNAQYGFLAHEAAHRQVFQSNAANKWSALILANLFVGLSYGWWDKKKHNLHHANPNTVDKDPDINLNVLAFTKESYDNKKGLEKFLTKRQGYLFPLLLLFTGFDLLVSSLVSLFSKNSKLEKRWLEVSLIIAHFTVPSAILFTLFSPWIAALFLIVQMMVFGLFMGGAFAPNHKGMPIIPKGLKIDYFRRQVLTSRNIKGNWIIDNLMGGLNYQIEHHLFPSMPRPNLRKASAIVKKACAEHDIKYLETRLFESYHIVISYLNQVGLKNSDPFDCPMVNQFRQV